MALIEKNQDWEWVFTGQKSKHSGERVKDVIESDPGYIAWVWRDVMPDLSDEAVDFLEDLMEEHGLNPYDTKFRSK
jgi:hypothetical protein